MSREICSADRGQNMGSDMYELTNKLGPVRRVFMARKPRVFAPGVLSALPFVWCPGEHFGSGLIAKAGRAKFVSRVWPKRGANHRSASRQRPPRPPNVQRGNMPVANRLLAPRVGGNALDRKTDFNESLVIRRRHHKLQIRLSATGITTRKIFPKSIVGLCLLGPHATTGVYGRLLMDMDFVISG